MPGWWSLIYKEFQKDDPDWKLLGLLGGTALIAVIPFVGDAASAAAKKAITEGAKRRATNEGAQELADRGYHIQDGDVVPFKPSTVVKTDTPSAPVTPPKDDVLPDSTVTPIKPVEGTKKPTKPETPEPETKPEIKPQTQVKPDIDSTPPTRTYTTTVKPNPIRGKPTKITKPTRTNPGDGARIIKFPGKSPDKPLVDPTPPAKPAPFDPKKLTGDAKKVWDKLPEPLRKFVRNQFASKARKFDIARMLRDIKKDISNPKRALLHLLAAKIGVPLVLLEKAYEKTVGGQDAVVEPVPPKNEPAVVDIRTGKPLVPRSTGRYTSKLIT